MGTFISLLFPKGLLDTLQTIDTIPELVSSQLSINPDVSCAEAGRTVLGPTEVDLAGTNRSRLNKRA